MAVKFTNNAATTLAAGINSSVTSIAVTDGSVFPTITGSDHFYVTFDDTTNKEIVKVTARSGNTLTVVRGHDNTTARAFSSGDKAELRIVAALLDDVKTDVSSTLTVDTFTGNGSTTAFTLSVAPASEDNLIVFIEGVYQNPGDFTLSGTTLTLDVAPANSRKIIVYHVAALVSGNNLTHNQFTCNGSTTAFTLGLSPIHENNTQVFLDGVYQQKTDYAVSGTTLTMDTAPANGAILEVMTFTQTEVNTLPASFVSGLTQVTAVGADHFMIFDATDSALKKSLVSDVLESATSISTSADATAITIDSNEKVTFTSDVTTGGHLSVGGSNNELRFYEGSNYVGFEAPALSADKIWVLPAADGSSGQVISTDGSGNLSFATVSGTTINNNADNRIITGSGTANTLNGEANLTFDSSLVITKSEGAANSLNDQISLEHTSGTTGYHIKTIRAAANDNPDGIAFVENTTERMRIRGGKVGIGTTDPSSGYGGAITAAKVAILSGTAGNNGGSSTLLIGGDDKHYAYMQGTHTSGGSTELDFGTANGANNPTLKMKIDSSGNITAPNQPSFMCYPTSGAWTQPGGSAQITFGSESFDKGGNYNTSNGRFTAPVAGRYLFIMELSVNASTSALTYQGIGLRINGSGSVYFGGWGQKNIGGSTNAYAKCSSTIILELSANDYVETYIELSGSHGLLGGTSGAHTRWSGQLLS